jgi:hypothetical protein
LRIAACALAFSAAAALRAAPRDFEKTLPVPRTGAARLDWTDHGCSVRSLRARNFPDAEDIDKARREDPGDHSWVWWEFDVENRGTVDCRIRLELSILDRRGGVVKSDDKTDTVDAGKTDDDIRLSTRVRTLDIADAPKLRIRAEIGPK